MLCARPGCFGSNTPLRWRLWPPEGLCPGGGEEGQEEEEETEENGQEQQYILYIQIYILEPIVFGFFVQSMAPQSSEALVGGSVGPLATCIPGHDGHPPPAGPIDVDEEEEEEEEEEGKNKQQEQHCVYLY